MAFLLPATPPHPGMGHYVCAKIWELKIHPVQDESRLHFPMDDPLLSWCTTLPSSFLTCLTLFIWALPHNTWQAVLARCQPWLHHQSQPKAIQEKASKPLIPIHTDIHSPSLIQTRCLNASQEMGNKMRDEQPQAHEMQEADCRGLRQGAPVEHSSQPASQGLTDRNQCYMDLGRMTNIWS